MNETVRQICTAMIIALAMSGRTSAIDTVELTTGAKATGTIKSYSGDDVVIDVKVGKRTLQQRYSKDRVKAIFVDGKQVDMKTGVTSATPSTGRAERSREDIIAEIDREGKTATEWYDATPLNYPETLDLAWPMPPPKGWNSSKNVGQFIWDRINPNANKWREGVWQRILAGLSFCGIRSWPDGVPLAAVFQCGECGDSLGVGQIPATASAFQAGGACLAA